MTLWVPPHVSAELVDVRRQHTAEVLDQARRDATLDYWTAELRKIDPYLSLIKAKEDADVPGLRPGFYHVMRLNQTAAPSLIVHEGPNGEFREPDSGLFDLLRRNDLWNNEAARDRKRLFREADEAARKRRETERQARREELAERVRAVTETSISMTDTRRPWTQTATARHG
jgi:hypothetical protein